MQQHDGERVRVEQEYDELTAETVIANAMEGELGQRGEQWVLGQAVVIASIVAAPALPLLSMASQAVGACCMLLGFGVAVVGTADLGNSLSPWPKPIESNELRTDGAYALCRHPMYAGFILCAGGFGVLTGSCERLLLAVVLYLFFSAKAEREEGLLRTKHGPAYSKWEASVPRFFPRSAALRESLASLPGP